MGWALRGLAELWVLALQWDPELLLLALQLLPEHLQGPLCECADGVWGRLKGTLNTVFEVPLIVLQWGVVRVHNLWCKVDASVCSCLLPVYLIFRATLLCGD